MFLKNSDKQITAAHFQVLRNYPKVRDSSNPWACKHLFQIWNKNTTIIIVLSTLKNID